MSASLAVESRALAIDVHELLSELDVARWRNELEAAARAKIAEIDARVHAVQTTPGFASRHRESLRNSVDELATVLRAHVPGQDLDAEQIAAEWGRFRAQLQLAYQAMAEALRAEAIHVPTRRPTNYMRNLLHFGGAGVALALVHGFLAEQWMLAIGIALAVWAWSMELGRRLSPRINDFLMWVLGPFAHPHEAYRINSATWYCTALFLLGLTGSKLLVLLAIAILGFADPAAALIGRRFGSIKLVNGRSLQGTGAFALVGTLSAIAVLAVARPELSPLVTLGMATSAALVAAVAELFSLRVDDNLSVPVAAAAGAGLVAVALGIAL